MKLNTLKNAVKSGLQKKRDQKGFTLVEVAIVVAVGALLLIGVSQAPTIIANNRANAEIAELPQVVANIQKIYANRSNFVGIDNAQVIGLKAFPEDRVDGAASLLSRWGESITVAPADVGTGTDNGVSLTYALVPSAECINVIQGVEGRFYTIEVAGTEVKTDGGDLDLAALSTQCNSDTEVGIVYTFKK